METGEEVRGFRGRPGKSECTSSLTLSPDGKRVLSSAVYGPVVLWGYDSGKDVSTLRAGANGTTPIPVAFSPDGRFAATGQKGATVRIWDLETAEEVAPLITFEDGEWVALTPEGYFNGSPDGPRRLRVRVGRSAYSLGHFFERYCFPGSVARRLSGEAPERSHDIRDGVAPRRRCASRAPRTGSPWRGNRWR